MSAAATAVAEIEGGRAGRQDVDAGRLAVVGICMGGSHVLPVAAEEPLVRAVAVVAGHYRDPSSDAEWLGDDSAVAARLERGQQAMARYEATGEVDYVPAVDFDRADVGMPGEQVWSWYQLWADRGLWENRYAVLSDVALLSFNSIEAAARLTKPLLMVHSDQCAAPDAARRHFAVVPTVEKRLRWEGATHHFQYYEDLAVVERTVCDIVDWFATHLGATQPHATTDRPDADDRRREHNAQVVRHFFELLGRKEVETWGQLWHEDARIIVPYPADGFSATLQGRASILSTFHALFQNFDSFQSKLTGVYPAADDDVVCVEYSNDATLANGAVYTNDNMAVFRLRDGLIAEYHDYFDPRRFQVVIDALSSPREPGRAEEA